MKVCLVSRYFELRNGGIGRVSLELYERLQGNGVQVTTISTNLNGSIGYFAYTALEMPFRVPKGYSVYHALSPMEAIYLPKERSIVTFHDLIPWLYFGRMERDYRCGRLGLLRELIGRYYFALASKVASRCKIIVCNSEQTRENVALHLNIKNEEKLRVIRLGISPQLKPEERKDRNGVFRIGTLSVLDTRKRIDLLIKGFLQANTDAELVIGGRGTDEARLRALSNEDKRIKFLGFIPDDRLVDFYNSLDIFVFPSALEGYGLPIIEAMACKKPVVVLKDAVIPEEIKGRCIVVESLKEFFKAPSVSCNIEHNYRFARLHDWEACVGEYTKVYQEVLG